MEFYDVVAACAVPCVYNGFEGIIVDGYGCVGCIDIVYGGGGSEEDVSFEQVFGIMKREVERIVPALYEVGACSAGIDFQR